MFSVKKVESYVDLRSQFGTLWRMRLQIKFNLQASSAYDDDAGVHVAWCHALDIFSQGESEAEAQLALKDALVAFLHHCLKRNLLEDMLSERGFRADAAGATPLLSADAIDEEYIHVRHVEDRKRDFEIDVPLYLIQGANKRNGDGASCRS